MTKSVTINKHLVEVWPGLKGKRWPSELGAQPTAEAVKVACSVARANTAVSMALAMYARSSGASDSMAATAASLATGSTSATHRVKRDQLAVAGLLTKVTVGHEGGKQVTRISLPTKAPSKPTGTRKRAAKGKQAKQAKATEQPAQGAEQPTQ